MFLLAGSTAATGALLRRDFLRLPRLAGAGAETLCGTGKHYGRTAQRLRIFQRFPSTCSCRKQVYQVSQSRARIASTIPSHYPLRRAGKQHLTGSWSYRVTTGWLPDSSQRRLIRGTVDWRRAPAWVQQIPVSRHVGMVHSANSAPDMNLQFYPNVLVRTGLDEEPY